MKKIMIIIKKMIKIKKKIKNIIKLKNIKKKFKKYINSDNEYIKTKILKKNINNARYINEKQIPHSYRNFGKKLTNIDENNLPFKKYKSGINENVLISNNLYNNTDERLNTNFNEYNKIKYENDNIKNKEIDISTNYIYNHIKNKSLNGINIKDYNNEFKNIKNDKYQRKKPNYMLIQNLANLTLI